MVTCQQPPSSPLPLSRTEKLVTGAGRAAKARVTKRCRTPAVARLWGHHQLREEKPPAHRHRSLGKARSCSRVIDLSPADVGHTGSHGASPCAPAEAGSPDPFLLSSSSGSASGRTLHTHTHTHTLICTHGREQPSACPVHRGKQQLPEGLTAVSSPEAPAWRCPVPRGASREANRLPASGSRRWK